MPYISLYRKYRSQTFEDVMGQEHVTRTLQNAIRQGKVGHAYLFCGTRGTGKTTTARLLAKAMNCETGTTPTPCNKCPACQSITDGNAMDIVELDAASHRSIRDVEEIRDNVKFPPMDLRYKVFIIDEAHQLSNDAKDAFLKTLEEPPPHAIFILATTEPQSIPVTIRSRCQQFDFRRGSLGDIRKRLQYVSNKEGVKVEDTALDLMTVSADGSWRDALSLLEQVLAYKDTDISAEDVNTVLGTVTQEFLFHLADVLADGREYDAFEAAAQVAESGKDIQQLLKSIAQHFRNLLFATVIKDLRDVTPNADEAAKLKDQAARFNRQSLLRIVQVLTEAEHDSRYSGHQRLLLEIALLKAIELTSQSDASQQAAHPAQKAETEPPRAVKPAPTKKKTPSDTEPMLLESEEPCSDEQRLPEFDRIKEKWKDILQHVYSISKPAHGLLINSHPTEVRDGALVLCFEGEGRMKVFQNEKPNGKMLTKKQALLKAIERVFGVSNAEIICEVENEYKSPPPEIECPDDDLPDPFTDTGQNTLSDVLDIFPNSKIID